MPFAAGRMDHENGNTRLSSRTIWCGGRPTVTLKLPRAIEGVDGDRTYVISPFSPSFWSAVPARTLDRADAPCR